MPPSTRRTFLGLAGVAPLVAFGFATAARAADAVCFNPDTLPASQKSMRKALGFVPVSTDPAKACGQCAFFTATAAGCGKCQLLTGGPVGATGVCRSWAKKG
ncbi:high-potential iron-sulfur protein [Sphingomonas sp. SUN039]|uniref:high-potential iron-sulfur protein n=1 Tax=Sphingomonas sp. SUN039 TaxID=2937787 RepID=UPI002164B80A|nr:high-potential iron-sulfur protein [Sphingomonas sp. SUN039]UVO52647.1 high-potential iron-sulfur protein [Sphingomonas sp. SUN039]